jgi:transcriptional regulator with XRE-family HTH domain
MEVKDRIIELRKHNRMSQDKFADKLGLKQGIISLWESGKTQISESNIKLICSLFKISEEWLRTGKGEMFYIDNLSPAEQDLLDTFRCLNSVNQNLISTHAQYLLASQASNSQTLRNKAPEAPKEVFSPEPDFPLVPRPAEKGHNPIHDQESA